MCNYYFDEDHGIAYKVDPIVGEVGPKEILVHTDVKVTNLKREKLRRTLYESYPVDNYDLTTARIYFKDTVLANLIHGTRQISEEEYENLKTRFEA